MIILLLVGGSGHSPGHPLGLCAAQSTDHPCTEDVASAQSLATGLGANVSIVRRAYIYCANICSRIKWIDVLGRPTVQSWERFGNRTSCWWLRWGFRFSTSGTKLDWFVWFVFVSLLWGTVRQIYPFIEVVLSYFCVSTCDRWGKTSCSAYLWAIIPHGWWAVFTLGQNEMHQSTMNLMLLLMTEDNLHVAQKRSFDTKTYIITKLTNSL